MSWDNGMGSHGSRHFVLADSKGLAEAFINAVCIWNTELRDEVFGLSDGFAGNEGILTLATTNRPERLDPAILDRPSRFDRKYPFNLPEVEERSTYIRMWNETLQPELRLSEQGPTDIAERTDDFSFTYLKELFVSATMRWQRG